MKGIVYKISSPSTDKIYIGSTKQSLKKRFTHHKYTNGCSSRMIINYGNAICELIEEYEYDEIKSLRKRERYHIELNRDICVNITIPTRSIKEGKIIYYQTHIDDIKKYRADNAEKIAMQKKIWYRNNLKHIKEQRPKRNRQIKCECGNEYSYSNKSRHLNSIKHKSFLKL